MTFSSDFFKAASICAFIAGLLWVALMFLAFLYNIPTDLESTIDMHGNPVALIVVSLGFLAMFFFIVAFWGTAAMKLKSETGLASTGFIFAFAGFLLQLTAFGIMLLPWSRAMAAYSEAEPGAAEIIKSTLLSGYFEVSAVLTYCAAASWAVMMLLYALATSRGSGLESYVSAFFFLLFASVVLNLLGVAIEFKWLVNLTIPIMSIFTTITMFVTGAWLWKRRKTA